MSSSGVSSSLAHVAAAEQQRSNSDWSQLPAAHKLRQFHDGLQHIVDRAGYCEMYGVELQAPPPPKNGDAPPAPHSSTLIILQKFLRANADDLDKAKEQLAAALQWRRDYRPLQVRDELFDGDAFGKLGYITRVQGAVDTANAEDVVTFNIYGAVAKDITKTCGDPERFVRWRVAQMERTLQELHLATADQPIPDYGKGPDPYKAIAVHDYLSVSFFRQPAEIKAVSTKIIDTFQRYYPETVSYKYFVNVPLVMQWMMAAMKALLSKDSIQTMTWMTYGSELHKYLGPSLPKEYGGSGPALEDSAITPNYGRQPQHDGPLTSPALDAVRPADGNAHPVTGPTPEVTGKPEEKATVA